MGASHVHGYGLGLFWIVPLLHSWRHCTKLLVDQLVDCCSGKHVQRYPSRNETQCFWCRRVSDSIVPLVAIKGLTGIVGRF